ncbi:RDD family protein [Kribbella antibiotica]|uniref:RDD family protein n=1 Tax=Kribbella antibiotica TaxID=190195 RepID=UPI001404389B|nr:RDD family protein [Kribbella antibiotica]
MNFPAGWYDDPQHPTQQRYWDGSVWTDERRPREQPSQQPAQQPSPYQGQYGQPAQTPQDQPQYGQPVQHGQVFGGAPQQQPTSDRPVYGQPGPQQPPQQQAGQQPGQYGQPPQQGYPAYPQQQQGYPAYPQQQAGYGYPGQNRFATPDGQPLSGWWRRVGARIIDNILAGIAALPLTGYFLWQYMQWLSDYFKETFDAAAAGASTPPTTSLPPEMYKWLIPMALISAAVAFAYEYFFLTKKGATPGKMALGIAVRLRDRPGLPSGAAVAKRAGFFAALSVLGLVPLVGTLLGLVGLLDYLWPLWDDKKQALHDKIAETNVVRT